MNRFHVLPALRTGHSALPLPQPAERRPARLGDLALEVFTDLRSGPSVVVLDSDGLDETLKLMLRAGVRMAFVADAVGGLGRAHGLITADELQGERPVVRALGAGLRHAELRVGDLMTRLADWPTVDMREVSRARVGDIVATLQASGQRYLLVCEESADATAGIGPQIRGLFSANRIAGALGEPLQYGLHSRNFAELEAALAHG